ncbi:hypothetical protein VTK56DRAFT_5073 [Thermocarpiscus australiensis]
MSTDLHLPHQLPEANETLTARCHCKSVHFTVTVPSSALPLPVHLCHCQVCRYVHGTLCSFHASLPKGVAPEFVAPSSLASSVTGYIHAQAASERLFCSTCGCHIGDRDLKPDPETGKPEWRVVATSIFAHHNEDTFQIRTHAFTNSAPGPNLATWLPAIGSRPIHVWNPAPSDTSPDHQPETQSHPPDKDNDDDALLAQCHCAGVRFTIPRPSPEEISDPFLSRFLRRDPVNITTSTSTSAAAADQQPLKRVASLCVCADCRLVTGAHAVAWTFVPLAVLRPAVPPSFDGFGTLRAYRSSPGVTRAFCGACGATVFYAVDDDERTPSPEKRVVDVAVGILRAREGPAAETWLAWRTGRVSWWESGREFDEAFAEGLRNGMEEWGVKRHGQVTTFTIPQE